MTKNSILRQKAREQLGGKIFAQNWLMVLVATLIYGAITGVAGSISVGIGAIIVSGPLVFGLSRVMIKRARNQGEVELGDLFNGFTECFGGSLILDLLTKIFVALWSILFLIPGLVKTYSYAMAPFILQDDPSKNWKQCLDESRAMMNGYKWKLFCLDFSFIGWYILGGLCFGIGTIFVIPYHEMARANFYLDLVGNNAPEAESI